MAEALFGDENALIRIDMSEYMEKHAVSRMVGSPPGYVGHDEGGQLTELVRRKPYSVILFDEIEKAHPEVFNILLQVLEDGRLTDSKGRVVDFRNTVLIMTSNVGASYLKKESLGFTAGRNAESEYKSMSSRIMEELKKTFKPEFLNRIDEMVVFHQLQKDELVQITEIMIKDISKRLKEQGYTLTLEEKALEYLAMEGDDPTYGARPLRRAIQKHIEDPLSEKILEGMFKSRRFDQGGFRRRRNVFRKSRCESRNGVGYTRQKKRQKKGGRTIIGMRVSIWGERFWSSRKPGFSAVNADRKVHVGSADARAVEMEYLYRGTDR